jgi:predicted negative regulator of RcsB-dependent stress response
MKKYLIHLTYCISFVLAVSIFVGYKVWDKQQLRIQKENRELDILHCDVLAREAYDNEMAKLCSNFKTMEQCKTAFAMAAPKRLELMADRFTKDQELCVKINS